MPMTLRDLSRITKISYNTLILWNKSEKSNFRHALLKFLTESDEGKLRELFKDVEPPKGKTAK